MVVETDGTYTGPLMSHLAALYKSGGVRRETILTFIAFTLCLTSLFLLHYEVMAVATNKYYFSLFGHFKKNNVFKNTIFELVFV